MAGPDSSPGLDPIDEGIRLFNDRYFFEAHEVLEEVWRREHGEPRLFLQGLIQICAAYHHTQNGNLIGAVTLLRRGADKIRGYPPDYRGIDVAGLVALVDADRERLERRQRSEEPEEPLEFPRIGRKSDDGATSHESASRRNGESPPRPDGSR